MEEITTRGGFLVPIRHQGMPPPRRALVGSGQPSPPLEPIFSYIRSFDLEKNKGRTFGIEHRRLEVELGQEHFCPSAERFHRWNFPPGGGNQSHRHHQQPSHLWEANLHQHLQHHHLISNPSSSLVFNFCIKTSDWYLWVASSVDYIS